ncbi:hypothetical protein [Limnohabitans planktonicus]|jgi:hypothetical protein|nr:hypothetical protein [Limnohabitans planktonicus]
MNAAIPSFGRSCFRAGKGDASTGFENPVEKKWGQIPFIDPAR